MESDSQPYKVWREKNPNKYPYKGVFYNWTRPGRKRDELVAAGVIAKVLGVWHYSPSNHQRYIAESQTR